MAQNKTHSVFLDSNVFISAALSKTGGSFHIASESLQGRVAIHTNPFVIAEVARIMRQKLPHAVDEAYYLMSSLWLVSADNPSIHEIQSAAALIDDIKDAPILAGALKSGADAIITLDRKHFMSEKLKTANLPVQILTPKEFIERNLR